MRRIASAVCLVLALVATPLGGQSSAPKKTKDDGPKPAEYAVLPYGIWRATLDGVPSITLTLANDAGDLGGTVVFYTVDGQTRRMASIEPHTLLHPDYDNNTLNFQVRRPDSTVISFSVVFTSARQAQIRCLNCGDNPTATLTKDEL